jgi:hypothetical protein
MCLGRVWQRTMFYVVELSRDIPHQVPLEYKFPHVLVLTTV